MSYYEQGDRYDGQKIIERSCLVTDASLDNPEEIEHFVGAQVSLPRGHAYVVVQGASGGDSFEVYIVPVGATMGLLRMGAKVLLRGRESAILLQPNSVRCDNIGSYLSPSRINYLLDI